MVVVKLKGGLGNQLFQYAFGKYMEKQGNGVAFNIQWFDEFKQRKFILPEIITKRIPLTKDKVTHEGYWQELKYTEPVKDELFKEANRIKENDVIGIHVRRGDFLKHPKYVKLDFEYYDKAYNYLIKKYGQKKIYIFSDDIEWCKKNFKYPDIEFINFDDYVCFEILRSCKYKIIANSSFSWWAAYLSNGITVVPETWYNNKKQEQVKNQITQTWKIIN